MSSTPPDPAPDSSATRKATRRGRTTFPAADPRHGTENGYKNLGCRCTRCRGAHAEDTYAQQQDRRGSLQPEDPRHGTYNGYRNYGCRCAECKAARLEYGQDYARRTGK